MHRTLRISAILRTTVQVDEESGYDAPEVLVEVTTAKRCRMASNDARYVMAA